MKKKILIILGIIFLVAYLYFREEIRQLPDYIVYGKITNVEFHYPLDNIEPKAIIYRMSKFPKRGKIKTISLKEFYKLGGIK